LLEFLGLAENWPTDDAATGPFPMRVPRSFASRMRRGDPRDPLLLQVLPSGRELDRIDGFVADPVGDLAAVAGAGLLRKYQGRALLLTTPACAVHCRYCFRKHFPYTEHSARPAAHAAAVAALKSDPTVTEVILSGGDPLSISDDRFAKLLDTLAEIPQLRRIRIHTRLPVVLPARVTADLIAALDRCRLPVAVVLHSNHPNELTDEVDAALAPLRALGISLLNQAVLLRGINDNADVLAALSEKGFDYGILPYYLHLLDPVAGAAHFDVAEPHARSLLAALRSRLPGYLVPRLVKETAGEGFKRPIPA